MNTLKFLSILVTLVAISLATSFQLAWGQNYYYGLGVQHLTIVDSIITIKFDPSFPEENYGDFANEIEALNEGVAPHAMFMGFEVFHVNPGHDIESLLTVIRSEPEVILAYPAYKDTGGFVFKLNDRIVTRYNDSVTTSQMDSIQSVLGLELIEGPYDGIEMRVLRIASQSPATSLEVANMLYESGLVRYSLPDFPNALFHNQAPNDPLYRYQYHFYNDGQMGGKAGIDIDAERAWGITQSIEGRNICVS